MRTLTITLILLTLLLGLGAGSVAAEPGGNGNGRAVGPDEAEGAGQGDAVANRDHVPRNVSNVSRPAAGRAQVGDDAKDSTNAVTAALDTLSPRPRVFSAHGAFVHWVAGSEPDGASDTSAENPGGMGEGRVMAIELESCSRIVRDATLSVDADAGGGSRLQILVDDQTRYHVRGGGGGFARGLAGLAIPVGAGVHVVGTAYVTMAADGETAAAPSPLYATRILFQLDQEEEQDADVD